MTSVIFAVVLFLTLGDPVFSCGKSGHRDIGKFFEALYLLSYTVQIVVFKSFCIRYQLEDGFDIYMSQ